MRIRQIVLPILAAFAVLTTAALVVRPVTAQAVKPVTIFASHDVKLFPETSRPVADKTCEGQIGNVLSRSKTFGFTVRPAQGQGELGFYVENNDTNKTIIETVLFAAQGDRQVRIYFDSKTSIAEAIQTWK